MDRQKIKDYSVIVSAIFTAVLVIAILTQTLILKADFDANTRPWISVDRADLVDDQLFFHYSNYGTIPNLTGEIKVGASKNEIIRDGLDKISEPSKMNVVLPTREIKHRIGDEVNQLFRDSVQEGDDFYLGILLEYDYDRNRNGWYGVIVKLNTEKNSFDIIDSWTK